MSFQGLDVLLTTACKTIADVRVAHLNEEIQQFKNLQLVPTNCWIVSGYDRIENIKTSSRLPCQNIKLLENFDKDLPVPIEGVPNITFSECLNRMNDAIISNLAKRWWTILFRNEQDAISFIQTIANSVDKNFITFKKASRLANKTFVVGTTESEMHPFETICTLP